MGHEDAGHYAAKHPKGTQIDPKIESAITSKLSDNRITCAAAHALAAATKNYPGAINHAARHLPADDRQHLGHPLRLGPIAFRHRQGPAVG